MCFPRLFALGKRQLSCALWMTRPQRIDATIFLLPPGHGRTPVTKYAVDFLSSASARPFVDDRTDIRWQRIRHNIFGVCHGEPEATQIVVLVVVAIPAAVVLDQLEFQPYAAGNFQRL